MPIYDISLPVRGGMAVWLLAKVGEPRQSQCDVGVRPLYGQLAALMWRRRAGGQYQHRLRHGCSNHLGGASAPSIMRRMGSGWVLDNVSMGPPLRSHTSK